MKGTRASFKCAFRYCRKNEECMKADKCEQSLNFKDSKNFWKNVNKM